MRKIDRLRIAVLLAGVAVIGVGSAKGQDIRGFAVATSTSDINHQRFTGLGGGVVIDAIPRWLSAGAQVDTYASGGYFTGHGKEHNPPAPHAVGLCAAIHPSTICNAAGRDRLVVMMCQCQHDALPLFAT